MSAKAKSNDKLTAVFGASPNPARYAYMAAERLHAQGFPFRLVSVKSGELFGEPFLDLKSHPAIKNLDTITLYIGTDHLTEWQGYILSLAPKRIIFNPGTENMALAQAAQDQGIEAVFGCTLVMLGTGQY